MVVALTYTRLEGMMTFVDICRCVGVGREGMGKMKVTPRYLASTSGWSVMLFLELGTVWKNPQPELI